MGKSGNPARRAEELKISQVGDFKKRLATTLELPSGFVVKVRNPGGLRVFLDGGMIPNSLMGIVKNSIDKAKPAQADDIMKKGFDQQMIKDMITMLDNIACRVITEPQIHPTLTQDDVDEYNDAHPGEAAETIEDIRRDDRLYADELPDDDKMFLFQWISGGTTDLETFRREHASGVDSMAAVSITNNSAK